MKKATEMIESISDDMLFISSRIVKLEGKDRQMYLDQYINLLERHQKIRQYIIENELYFNKYDMIRIMLADKIIKYSIDYLSLMEVLNEE